MKKSKLNFLVLSLPAAALMFPYSAANAALRVTNSSLVKEQAQLNAARNTALVQEPQPARVFTNENGETVSVSDDKMDACNSIYPNGKFDWAKPTAGMKSGGSATCVALVELRAAQQNSMGYDASYSVLARTYLAAGDAMKCNIDNFAEVTAVGMDFTYPADVEPTLDEVKKVMAQEQKQNAGFKILGAALVGGIGGNLLGANDPGNDSVMGLGKNKLKSTAIGAAGAAALMTASTQSNNYKTGNIILSTGVNGVAGAVAGNLNATGDDVLNFTECKIDKRDTICLYGALEINSDEATEVKSDDDSVVYLYNPTDNRSRECYILTDETGKPQRSSGKSQITNCRSVQLSRIELEGCNGDEDVKECGQNLLKKGNVKKWTKNSSKADSEILIETKGSCDDEGGCFITVKKANLAGKRKAAMIEVADSSVTNKFFGYKRSNWNELAAKLEKATIYDTRGNKICADGTSLTGDKKSCDTGKEASIDNFYPTSQSVEDSDTVDFGNKARRTSTLVGAGAGAGLGALSGAMGADAAINDRWLAATREYKDSLLNIWCYTGERPLGTYNQSIVIPEMKTTE